MSNASKAVILEMAKKSCMEHYQALTPDQQENYKTFPQELSAVKSAKEALTLTKPIYLLVKNSKA